MKNEKANRLKYALNIQLKKYEKKLYESLHIPYLDAVNCQCIEIKEIEYIKLSGNIIYCTLYIQAHIPWDLKEQRRKKLIKEIRYLIKKQIDKNIKIKGKIVFYVHCYSVYGAEKEFPKGKWNK